MNRTEPIDLFRPVRWIAALTLAVVVAITLLQITLRYVFNAPLIWSEELVKLLTVWITFIGAAAVCFDGRHLNVDVFFRMLPPRARNVVRWINAAISLAFLIVLGWTSLTLVELEMMQELSAIPLAVGHIRLAATFGAALMIAAIVARILYFRPARRRIDTGYGSEDAM